MTDVDGRSLLLGAGLFGMAVGAALGVVAGAKLDDCGDAAGIAVDLCSGYQDLRSSGLWLVALSAAGASFALFEFLRRERRLRLRWVR